MGNSSFNGTGNLIGIFVNISQMMGLINNHQVPIDLLDIGILWPGKVVRTDNDFILMKWVKIAFPDFFVEGFRFKDTGREEKLICQFLIPLFPEAGGDYNQYPSLPFSPFLRKDNTGLYGLAKANLICQNCSFV